jgi:metallophosphoesterase (TIGR00282 family)
MKIIFLGDVFGKPGRNLVLDNVNKLKQYYNSDFFIINGENLADGKGLTEKTAKPLFEVGIDLITGGNHLWDRAESLEYIRSEYRILKPLNYPDSAYGTTWLKLIKDNYHCIVVCLTGQLFMPPCDSPFSKLEQFLSLPEFRELPVFVDFHAESTAEKRAFAHQFDGRVSAIVGTHTHIQTADEEIMPLGTGYLTDAGMTGAHDSVIGIKKQLILQKMVSGMPVRYEVSDQGLQINGVFLEIDPHTRKTIRIERIRQLIQE